MSETVVKYLMDRRTRIKTDSTVWRQHCQEVRNVIAPVIMPFIGHETRGKKAHRHILDNTGETASDIFGGGITSLVANPGTEWFQTRAQRDRLNRSRNARIWLDAATEIMHFVFLSRETQGHRRILEAIQSIGDFGQGHGIVIDRPGRLPFMGNMPTATTFIAENEDGIIDTWFGERWMNVRAAHNRFKNKAGATVIDRAKTGTQMEDNVNFLNAILPTKDLPDRPRGAAGSKPFVSIWVNEDDKVIAETEGLDDAAAMTGRWQQRDREVNGRGPGFKALSDVAMLQRIMAATIKGGETAVRPPLLVADQGVVGNVRLRAGALTFIDRAFLNNRQPPVQPLFTGADPRLGEELSEGIRIRIGNSYQVPLLRKLRDPNMTATQFLALEEELIRVAGPYLFNVTSQLIAPWVERTFNVLQRAGAFPPPPEELIGEDIEVEYDNPMSKAHNLGVVTSMSRAIEISRPLAAADAAVDDNLDTDGTYREIWNRLGNPRHLLRDPRMVGEMREARTEMVEAQQNAGLITEGAKAAQSLSQAAMAGQNANDDNNAAA